jgi:hypothetical protein
VCHRSQCAGLRVFSFPAVVLLTVQNSEGMKSIQAGTLAHACILATQEAEIRRITVRSWPGEIAHETLSQKNPSQKRAGGVEQGVGPEFKSQYRKKKKRQKRSVQTEEPLPTPGRTPSSRVCPRALSWKALCSCKMWTLCS